jgi:hypothetical protein
VSFPTTKIGAFSRNPVKASGNKTIKKNILSTTSHIVLVTDVSTRTYNNKQGNLLDILGSLSSEVHRVSFDMPKGLLSVVVRLDYPSIFHRQ